MAHRATRLSDADSRARRGAGGLTMITRETRARTLTPGSTIVVQAIPRYLPYGVQDEVLHIGPNPACSSLPPDR